MTNQEILTKAIHKAIDKGYKAPSYLEGIDWRVETPYTYSDIIFNHDFAKALWGEDELTVPIYGLDDRFYYEENIGEGTGGSVEAPAYLFHLQQMVIADDPIKYLGEHL